jgi:hypothetical protein
MSYFDLAGHGLTYATVIAGVLYIIALTFMTLRKSWKHALAIGYTREWLWRIVKSSVSYSIVPSLAVLVGFFTLAPLLGVPLSLWRLSVVGNTAYEIMTANMALGSAGVSEVAKASTREFILIIYVMAIGIMGGMVFSCLFAKKIHMGTYKTREKDRRWGALSNGIYIQTILLVFIIPIFFSFNAALLTFITSGGVALILNAVIRKSKIARLNDFSAALSMIIAMVSSVYWTRLFGA